MQLNHLKKNKSNRKAKQVGRGGTRGKTSGRGTKGQNARAGRKKRPEMRDFIKRLPKLRGRGRNFLKTRLKEAEVITLSQIEKTFETGATITYKTLEEKGLLKMKNGKMPRVKILAPKDQSLSKTLTFEKIEVSESAKKLIEAARGKVNNE